MPAPTKYNLGAMASNLTIIRANLDKLTSENLLDGCLAEKKAKISAFISAFQSGNATDDMYESVLQLMNGQNCLGAV